MREDILAATPQNFGGPERQARFCMPRDFYDGSADRSVIGELKRLRKAGKIVQKDGEQPSTRCGLRSSRLGGEQG